MMSPVAIVLLGVVVYAIAYALVRSVGPAPPAQVPRPDYGAILNRILANAAGLRATERAALAIELTSTTDDDVYACKVGGRAYWPAYAEYPRDGNGRPLVLLAQIDFSAAPPLEGFPRDGMLQFFLADHEIYGDRLGEWTWSAGTKWFRVVYWPAPLDAQLAKPPDGAFSAEHMPHDPRSPRGMRFRPVREIIGYGDAGMERALGQPFARFVEEAAAREGVPAGHLDGALHDQLFRTGHKLGGHPGFTQSDPRTATDRHVLLFQLDSDDHILSGDVGIANFFILPEDLERREFGRVAFYWDCL